MSNDKTIRTLQMAGFSVVDPTGQSDVLQADGDYYAIRDRHRRDIAKAKEKHKAWLKDHDYE